MVNMQVKAAVQGEGIDFTVMHPFIVTIDNY
jgi:hypothetical protein